MGFSTNVWFLLKTVNLVKFIFFAASVFIMVPLICFHFVHRDCFYPVLSGLSFYLPPPPPPSTCSTPPLKVCILIMIALGIGTGRLDMTAPSPWVWRYRHCFFFSSPLITLFFFSSPPILIPTSCELRSYRSMSGKPGRARKTWIGETEQNISK